MCKLCNSQPFLPTVDYFVHIRVLYLLGCLSTLPFTSRLPVSNLVPKPMGEPSPLTPSKPMQALTGVGQVLQWHVVDNERIIIWRTAITPFLGGFALGLLYIVAVSLEISM